MDDDDDDRALMIRDMSRTYPGEDHPALDHVSMDVTAGEFVAIMGASGSGKSTLLRCASSLDAPDPGYGAVRVFGVDVPAMSVGDRQRFRARTVGFAFQSYDLIPVLNARENIIMVSGMTGEPVDGAWLAEVAGRFVIADLLERPPSELSGGEAQRVSIARAIIRRPRILFADEPTGALDAGSSATVMALIRALCDDEGMTVVMVTHDPLMAAYADRTVRLADGAIAS